MASLRNNTLTLFQFENYWVEDDSASVKFGLGAWFDNRWWRFVVIMNIFITESDLSRKICSLLGCLCMYDFQPNIAETKKVTSWIINFNKSAKSYLALYFFALILHLPLLWAKMYGMKSPWRHKRWSGSHQKWWSPLNSAALHRDSIIRRRV